MLKSDFASMFEQPEAEQPKSDFSSMFKSDFASMFANDEPVASETIDWVARSTDPNHPFKRTLKKYTGKFFGAIGAGAAAAQEFLMRGGRRSGEFEGVDLSFGAEKPPSPEDMMAVDALREKIYEGVNDEEVKDVLEKAEMLGGLLPSETAIFKGVAGIKKMAEFNKAVGNIAKSTGKSRFDVLGELWNSSKNYLKEKFKWPQSKVDAFEKGEVSVLKPEEAKAIVDQAHKVELDITPPKEAAKPEPVKPNEVSPVTDFEALPVPQQEEYSTLLKEAVEIANGVPIKQMGDEQAAKYLKVMEKLSELSYLNDYDKQRFAKKAQEVRTSHKMEKELAKQTKEEAKAKEEAKPVQKAKEPEKPAAPKEEKPSGYVRKPEPKTHEEKVAHLSQKVKESSDFAESMTTQIEETRAALAEEKAKPNPDKLRIHQIRSKIDELLEGRASERDYTKQLKNDLKRLKAEGEQSTVQVPLGMRPKAHKRPAEKKLAPRRPVMGRKQAKKRSEIIKTFKKAFNDPIRLGKFKQRAAGIHKMWPRVTRLLKANDVETAAHEIGHNLHTVLYGGNATTPAQQSHNVSQALRPYLGELKNLAMYEPYGMEGFAEFTRLYVTNPDVARQEAPQFYQKFEADLDADYPELKNALLKAREYYEDYLQGTPQSRIRAQTDYAADITNLDQLFDWVNKNLSMDNLKTQFLDDVFPAKRLVAEAFGIPLSEVENLKDPRNLYRAVRILKGAVGKAEVFLMHETFDPITLKRIGRGLRSILSKIKTDEEFREFNDYLIARRVTEKSPQGIETGISYGDALVTERQLAPKYKQTAILLDKYNDALLAYAQHSGMISQEQYKLMKQNNLLYTPFQRVMEKESGGLSSKLQARKTIKQMKGSQRDIIAPVESIVKNTYAILLNAEKNLAGQTLAELSKMKGVGQYVERVPTPTTLKAQFSGEEIEERIARNLHKMGLTDLLEAKILNGKATIGLKPEVSAGIPDLLQRFGPTTYPAGENIITVYRDGKPEYYEVSPDLFDMWNKGMAPYSAGLITKILRIPARTLRAGAVLNPRFMQKNVFRDFWGGILFTKYGKDIKDPAGLLIDTLYSPLAMLATAAKKGKLYVQWMKAGGGMSTMQSLDRQAIQKKLEEVQHGIRAWQPIKMMRKLAEISEESNRLAEFARALEVEGQTRLGLEIAAFAARDLSIDFAKIGLQTRALNQISSFWNATIQGSDKLFRTLASDEDRMEFIARGIAAVVIPSLIFAWLNHDDDRVKEFQEQEKDFNFITFIGDTAIKIPVPFESGVILHGLTQRLYNYFIKKDPEAFEGFMGSIKDAMIPDSIPTFAKPFMETWANKSFFTGGRIIPHAKEGLVSKYQYKNNSSLTARLIGRAMTYMLGQDTRSKAASPAVIDHFIQSWGGGLGSLIVKIADAGLELAGMGDQVPRPDESITERFGLSAFSARYPRASTRSIEKFYDYYQEATARKRSADYARKMGEPDEAINERIRKLDDYPALQRAYKSIQNSQRSINSIWLNPDIDSETKRKLIDDLYLQQIEFAKAAVESIRTHRRETSHE